MLELQRRVKSKKALCSLCLFFLLVLNGCSNTCQYTRGPKAGQIEYFPFPAYFPVFIGSPCTDGYKSYGFAVDNQTKPEGDSPDTSHLTTPHSNENSDGLRLPFEGRWKVLHGPKDLVGNHHLSAHEQKFAYDFVPANSGSWIVAPAEGRIIKAIDGFQENPPGRILPNVPPAGNHIVMKLGRKQYAVFAHFRTDTIRVEAGDEVRKGARLGRSGNSGRSTGEHLHFHIQTTPNLFTGDPVLPSFQNYFVGNHKKINSIPRRYEVIEPR